ncbi:MAG: type II toxin-antitoxin system VapB family antitoxin [Xanthomonadales bacterium]|jgi:Arc/MetJ family transcription regulator|nr:type II toxin-antitoxin system VapB family antitoxin [Xanthomonadales bacterium]
MRTNIVIDDELMAEAQRLTGIATKRETVEQALRELVRLKRQEAVRSERGRLSWEGDLDRSRRAR